LLGYSIDLGFDLTLNIILLLNRMEILFLFVRITQQLYLYILRNISLSWRITYNENKIWFTMYLYVPKNSSNPLYVFICNILCFCERGVLLTHKQKSYFEK